MTLTEAAKKLKISRQRAYRLMDDGKIKFIGWNRGKLNICPKSVAARLSRPSKKRAK